MFTKIKMEQKREYRQERFQFVLSVNDNIICQRYFRINGFNEDSLNSLELKETVDEITTGIISSIPLQGMDKCLTGMDRGLINSDLVSKSRVYLWYTNNKMPMKLTGFENPAEATYIEYENAEADMEEWVGKMQNPWEITFKFSFLVDEREVCTRIWDGSAYPKYVRDSVDITNKKSSYENEDVNRLSFSANLIRHMTIDKTDLVYSIIEKFCDVLSSTYTKQYYYTKVLNYGNGKQKSKHGKKTYHLNNKYYINSLEKLYANKTKQYMDSVYPSRKECEYYNNCL